MLSHWGELWPVVGENMELRVGNIRIAGVGGRRNAAFLKKSLAKNFWKWVWLDLVSAIPFA